MRRFPLRALLTMATVAMATCGANLRADEFLCEEAHARLVLCCPGFQVDALYCTYETGCTEGTRYPYLSQAESECIRNATCAYLTSKGVCERAAKLKPAVEGADAGLVRPYDRPEVCP